MLSIYPACFFKEDNGRYSVVFPDLNWLSTQGDTLEEAVEMSVGNISAPNPAFLCAQNGFSFRKEISFLPHKNGRRGREMLHTDSFPAHFLTLRGLFQPFFPDRGRSMGDM